MKALIWIVAAILLLARSNFAMDNVEINKRIQDLKHADPKVRAAAVSELTTVYLDIMVNLALSRQDTDPIVLAAHEKADSQMAKAYQKGQEQYYATPRGMALRIAGNENSAANSCKAYVDAQEIFHRKDWDGDGVKEYARAFKGDHSLLDKKDGDNLIAVIGKALADAEGEPGKATPLNGYCFKILTRQGESAKLTKDPESRSGAKDYIVNGNMTEGFALIAYPAEYSVTGKNCFMINQAGTLWKRDFGAETHDWVKKVSEFNPIGGWIPAQ